MGNRVVVYNVAAGAEPAGDIAQRLRSNGVTIIEQQAHMLLVSGNEETIASLLRDTSGWTVIDLRTVPHPRTRPRVLKKP